MGLTVEQQRALALARARMRVKQPQAAALPQQGGGFEEFKRNFQAGNYNPPIVPKTPERMAYDKLPGWQKPLVAADDTARMLGSGMSFGGIDKLAGYMGGEGTEAERAKTEAARARAGSAAPAAEGVGMLTGLAALPAVAPFRAAGTAAKIGNVASTGAVYGGGIGAMQDADSLAERAKNTGISALTGVTIGTAAYPLVRGGAKIAQKFMGPKTQPAPSVDQLKGASKQAYNLANQQGVVIKPDSFRTEVVNLGAELTEAGFHPALHPRANVVLQEMGRMAKSGAAPSLEKVEQMRRFAQSAAKSLEADERRIGGMIIDKIDDYMDNLSPANLVQGNAPAASAALKDARSLWRRSRNAEMVDEMTEKAKNALGANYTSAGMSTALRQQFRSLANNPKRFRRFTADEQAAITDVVRGGKVENALRLLGKFAPQGAISTVLSGGLGYAVGNAPGAVMLPALGAASKAASSKMTMANVDKASDLMRRGSPMNIPKLPKAVEDLLLRISGQGGGILSETDWRKLATGSAR